MNGAMSFWLPVAIAFSAASVGAVTDVVYFRVRNAITFPLIAGGMAYHFSVGGWNGLVDSSWGVVFGVGVLLVPWLLGLMGGGDVKLLAGVGAWLGMPVVLCVFLVATAASFIYASALILYRGKLRESLLMMKVILYRFLVLGTHFGKEDLMEECYAGPDRRLRVIPFGAMVPLGILGAILWLLCFKGMNW
jgi:prepilin peptidase CpaA